MKRVLVVVALLSLTVPAAVPAIAQNGKLHPPITPDNAAQVVQLEVLSPTECGMPFDYEWSPTRNLLAIAGPGVCLYDAEQPEAGARVLPGVVQYDTSRHGVNNPTPESEVSRVVFSPDGSLLAAVSKRNVGVWDVAAVLETGAPLYMFELPVPIDMMDVLFSLDGSVLAFAGREKDGPLVTMFWDMVTGETLSVPEDGANTFGTAYFPFRGRRVGMQYTSWLVDLQQPDATPQEINGSAVIFAQDRSRFAYVDADGLLHVVESVTGATVATWEGPTSRTVIELAFNTDGQQLIVQGRDSVSVWAINPSEATGDLLAEIPGIDFLSVGPDDALLAYSAADEGLVLVDVQTGDVIRAFESPLDRLWGAALNADGTLVALSGGFNPLVQVLNIDGDAPARAISGHPGAVYHFAYTPDGSLLASAGSGGVRLWDAETGRGVAEFVEMATKFVTFSPDGSLMATASASGGQDFPVRVWDVASGALLHVLDEDAEYAAQGGYTQIIAFSPDGERLYTQTGIWDVATAAKLFTVSDARLLAVSPDGALLAYATENNDDEAIIRLQSGKAGVVLHTLHGDFTAQIMRAAFSPDGQRLIVGDSAGNLHQWRISGAGDAVEDLGTLEMQPGSVEALVFSSDGKLLASGTRSVMGKPGDTVRIWDVESGAILHELEQAYLTAYQGTLAFSPDGQVLATTTWPAARLWDVTSGELLIDLQPYALEVHTLAFSPDGTTLVTGGGTGEMQISGGAPVVLWGVP